MVVHWTFRDVWQTGPSPYSYTVPVNPNDGGTPTISRNITQSRSMGPRGHAIAQEGSAELPAMTFSGVILTQAHLEALELWVDKRILIEITDDLGRKITGVFSEWNPKRVRRAFNPWYHTYDATFAVLGYKNASGQSRYAAG